VEQEILVHHDCKFSVSPGSIYSLQPELVIKLARHADSRWRQAKAPARCANRRRQPWCESSRSLSIRIVYDWRRRKTKRRAVYWNGRYYTLFGQQGKL